MNDLESRLRRDLSAVADAILTIDERDAPKVQLAHDPNVQSITRSQFVTPTKERPSRLRPIVAVAASLIVAAGVVGTVAFGTRTTQPEEPSTANQPTAPIPPVVPPTTAASEPTGPVWLSTINDLLPDEFTVVGIVQSVANYVTFEAVDPTTTRTLSINISRGPQAPDPSGAIPIAEARTTDWANASPIDINVSLLDGRQVSVGCSVNSLVEPDCPPINGTTIEAELLGKLAVSLADQLPNTDLPAPSDALDHVSVDQITTAVHAVLDVDEQYSVAAPQLAFSFAAYGDIDENTAVHVRTVSGLMRTQADQPNEGEIELPERRISWATLDDGTIWTVTTSLDLPPETGRQILDAASQL